MSVFCLPSFSAGLLGGIRILGRGSMLQAYIFVFFFVFVIFSSLGVLPLLRPVWWPVTISYKTWS
ncbi:hypothetical protein BDW62DRAFT_125923 [Aspergillus aurantiobrunneus]